MSVPAPTNPTTADPAQSEARVATRLVEFNLRVARFAHRSWYPDTFWSGALTDRAAEPIAHRHADIEAALSDWLLSELGVRGEMDWDLREPQKRLWLLDTPSLQALAYDVALCMHREWLSRWIDGTRVRALLTKVPRSVLRFALQEIPPGSFHYQVPLVGFDTETSLEIEDKLTRAGVRTLMGLLRPQWHALRARAQLRFDKSLQLNDVQPFEDEHHERALDLICRKVLPRRAAAWAWLF